jgi:hypothetical protein
MKSNTADSKQKAFVGGLAAALLAFATLTIAAEKKEPVASASVFVQDNGKFNIQLNGKTVGHEEFEISPVGATWKARGATDLKPPDSDTMRISGMLTLNPDGTPVSYEWTTQTDKKNGAHISFANGTARIVLEMQGATNAFEQDLSFGTPLIAVLDNNLYYQYAVLARVYDWSKRGTQNLPVLIPQELTPGTLAVESAGTLSAGGKSYDGLRVNTADLEVLLYLDANHRLMRLEVPSAKVSVIRQ